MNNNPANPALAELPPPVDKRWSPTRWLVIIALIFVTHVALILLSGQKKSPVPRVASNVPKVQLASATDELIALDDPTLFALARPKSFAAAGSLEITEVKPLSYRWTEPPRLLPLSGDGLGAALGQFLQTNFTTSQTFNFKPVAKLSVPAIPVEPLLAQNSVYQLEGELAQRQLPSEISLTNWPYPNIIAPSEVQLLVDPAGNVASAVLLSPNGGFTAADQYPAADQHAVELARTLRFAPAPHPTVGRVIFNWQTVPVMLPTTSP